MTKLKFSRFWTWYTVDVLLVGNLLIFLIFTTEGFDEYMASLLIVLILPLILKICSIALSKELEEKLASDPVSPSEFILECIFPKEAGGMRTSHKIVLLAAFVVCAFTTCICFMLLFVSFMHTP